MEIRTLRQGELEQAWELDRDAFHSPAESRHHFVDWHAPERFFGAFESGRLVAMSGVLPTAQFFGGRAVSMGGVCSVAVAPDWRGAGIGGQVVAACLEAMRERGEVLSTLFPATTRVYRALGWELAGSLAWRSIPTRNLAAIPRARARDVSVRPVVADDRDAVRACYARTAQTTNGYLDRGERRWGYLEQCVRPERSAYLVAGPDGVDGYLTYQQLDGEYSALGGPFQISCDEIVWNTPDAGAALWGLLGSWAPQTDRILYRGGAEDPLLLLMPEQESQVLADLRWMSRLVDVEGAIAQRGFADGLTLAVAFELDDPQVPANSGRYWLRVEKGRGALERGGPGGPRMGPRALAALYTGWATPALLTRAGLLEPGSPADHSALTAAFAGPTPSLLDEF